MPGENPTPENNNVVEPTSENGGVAPVAETPGVVSSSPDASGLKISVATYGADGTPSTPIVMGHVDDVGTIKSYERAAIKHTPINDTQYQEIVSLGSLSQQPFSMTVLYDPSATEGINALETAILANTEVQLTIELNDSKGTNGTTYKQKTKCSNFSLNGAKGDKLKASFTAEKIGLATEIKAS